MLEKSPKDHSSTPSEPLGVQKIAGDLGGVVEGGLVVAATLPLWFVPLLKLAAVGAILVLARAIFIELCPTMASASVLVALLVNSVLIAVSQLVDIVSIITSAIAAMTGNLHAPTFFLYTVSAADIRQFLTVTPIECQEYDSVSSIFSGIMKFAASDAVCPQLRYIYPVTWARDAVMPLLGPLSFGPDPDGNNCAGEFMSGTCIVIGIGYLILEVLLPMVLAALLLPILKPIFALVLTALNTALNGVAKLLQTI
jgi:hypothetical protein